MPKGPTSHPMNLVPPATISGSTTVTDPAHPDKSWSFEFVARPDQGTKLKIQERARRFADRFLPPSEITEEEASRIGDEELARRAERYTPIHGRGGLVVVTWELIYIISSLMASEKIEEGDTAWDFEEWAIFSASAPTAFEATVKFFDSLRVQMETRLGNSTAGTSQPAGS